MTQKGKVEKGRSRSEISVRRLHISAIVRAWSQGPSRLLPKFPRSRPLALPTLADSEPDLKILSRQVDSKVEVSEEKDTIHAVLERTLGGSVVPRGVAYRVGITAPELDCLPA